MAASLQAFLMENALPMVETRKIVVSKRFLNDGKPVEWEIQSITAEEDDELRKACVCKVPAPGRMGKRGQYITELDSEKYTADLIARCVVFPNLNDKTLQDSYHAMGAQQLIGKMLRTPERDDLLLAIQELCGFDISMSEKEEEVKN